jgi:hypothetical protein
LCFDPKTVLKILKSTGLSRKYEDKAILAITAGVEYMIADFLEACFDVIVAKKDILKLKNEKITTELLAYTMENDKNFAEFCKGKTLSIPCFVNKDQYQGTKPNWNHQYVVGNSRNPALKFDRFK